MASASDPPAHPALQPADQLILPPQPPPPAVETSIGPPHCPPEAPSQTRSFNRACAPARGTQTLIRFKSTSSFVSSAIESRGPILEGSLAPIATIPAIIGRGRGPGRGTRHR